MLLNGVSAETVITKVKTEDLRSWEKKKTGDVMREDSLPPCFDLKYIREMRH